MNFESLYKIKNKLDSIYKKLEIITDNKYNSKEIKKCFDAINTYLENYENVPNSIASGNVQVQKEDKSIKNMLEITISLEKYVDKIYSCFRIFDDIKKVNSLFFGRTPSMEETMELSKMILNDLLDYKKLIDEGVFEEDRFNNELAPDLYALIKSEVKWTGKSNILNTLENMNIDISSINNMLIEEANDLVSKDDIKDELYKLSFVYMADSKIDKKLLLLVSTYNDNFRLETSKLLRNKLKELNKANDSYNNYKGLRKKVTKKNKDAKHTIRAAYGNLLHNIIPALLSLSILVGANIGAAALTKPFKHVKGTTYSTSDGYYPYEATESTSANEGDVIVEVVTKARGSGERDRITYVLPKTSDDIESYADVELDDTYLDKIIHSSINKNETPDEYRNIVFVEYAQRDGSIHAVQMVFHAMFSILWTVIDLLISIVSGVGFAGIFCPIDFFDNLSEFLNSTESAIKYLKEAKEELYTLDNGKSYNKEELKRRKEELLKIEKEYNELLNKYSYMLDLFEKDKIVKKMKF